MKPEKKQSFLRYVRFCVVILFLWSGTGCQTQLMPTPNLYLSNAGCKNIFSEVPPDFQKNTVDILYVTDRKPEISKQGQLLYGYGRSPSIAFGSCLVEMGKDVSWETLTANSCKRNRSVSLPLSIRQITEIARSVEIPIPLVKNDDGSIVEDPQAKALQQEMLHRFHEEIKRRLDLTPRKEAFIYIHGYSNIFEDPMFVMAGLWHFLGRQGLPIVYTWPSGGKSILQGYTYDRESSEFTVYHLKVCLTALASCPDLQKIHIISHSRGTDVATTAIGELFNEIRAANQSPRTELKIGNLIVAAPDIDMEVSFQKIATKRLAMDMDRFTMYVSDNDRAIGLSSWMFNSMRRWGQARMQDIPESIKKSLKYVDQFQIINARVRTDSIGHSYFHTSPAVSSDVILLLRDNRGPGKQNGRPLTPVDQNYWRITDDYLVHKGRSD